MIKLTRPGASETTVMLCQYFSKLGMENSNLDNIENEFINWLYSSAGFYDKAIQGNYFDINTNQVKQSLVYHTFIDMLLNSIENASYWHIFLHDFFLDSPYIEQLTQLAINKKVKCSTNKISIFNPEYDKYIHYWCMYDHVLPLLQYKRVLVINSFYELIQHQYITKNLFKIYPSLNNIQSLLGISTPFTFFNKGKNDHYLINIEKICNQIQNMLDQFDIAVIGCGPMGCILTDYIHKQNKDAIHMGSGIHKLFGIDGGGTPRPYWITDIPKHLVPIDVNNIENGRYWYGN